ncbi:unnamed protein product [Macrosiphum euphorbiae]|uniref:C2H2-type domain-containing protein n=1 Tax=Macrosiphum euphorbiae TaxID=13131 RepID=A0AAV0WIV3_9HEMI|nr:unnamed protein product [Macrosiphum euphorbiae]
MPATRAHTGSSQVAGPSSRQDATTTGTPSRLPVPSTTTQRRRATSQQSADPHTSSSITTSTPTRRVTAPTSTATTTSPTARRQPVLSDLELQFFFPAPQTLKCPVEGCSAQFRAEAWTAAKQSVTRHVRSMHNISVAINVHCSGCDVKLGVRPGSHKCTVLIAVDVATTARFTCPIDGCEKSYPSKQGLANHIRNHRRQDAVNAATVPMPRPATRQQRRVDPRPAPRRGGDARVPVLQVADAGVRNNNGRPEPRTPGRVFTDATRDWPIDPKFVANFFISI